jgi:hypothetical protein
MSTSVRLRIGTIEATGDLTPGSMAEAMYQSLNSLIKPHPDEDPKGRQKLMIAIATGVINHLIANKAAFSVTVPDTVAGETTHEQTVTIDKW